MPDRGWAFSKLLGLLFVGFTTWVIGLTHTIPNSRWSVLLALLIVAEGNNRLRSPENAIILVTHYQRILNYITPDYVHVLFDGRIVRSGGPELAHELEEKGYDWIKDAVDAGV